MFWHSHNNCQFAEKPIRKLIYKVLYIRFHTIYTSTPGGGLNMAYKYNAADWACWNKPPWLFSREGVGPDPCWLGRLRAATVCWIARKRLGWALFWYANDRDFKVCFSMTWLNIYIGFSLTSLRDRLTNVKAPLDSLDNIIIQYTYRRGYIVTW